MKRLYKIVKNQPSWILTMPRHTPDLDLPISTCMTILNLQKHTKKALALDSCNTSIEAGYKAALSKLSGTPSSSSPSPPTPSSPSGMDFGSLLKDPNMVNMAKNLMSNGGFADLLKNPNIAQMAQNMFGGDPQTMQNMFQTLSKASSTSPPPPLGE